MTDLLAMLTKPVAEVGRRKETAKARAEAGQAENTAAEAADG